MAGERLGKAFEALIQLALQTLVTRRRIQGKVHWNVPIQGTEVEPDLWIETRGQPTAVFLVTHSHSKKNANMKFWRDAFELTDLKLRFGSQVRVVSIYGESEVADALVALETMMFDAYVDLPDLDPKGRLRGAVEVLARSEIGTENFPQSLSGVERLPEFKALCDRLSALVPRTTRAAAVDAGGLWSVVAGCLAARGSSRAPNLQPTAVRRGISKLLVAEDPQVLLDAVNRSSREMPEFLAKSGIVAQTISGYRVVDPDIRSTVDLLGREACSELCSRYLNNNQVQAMIRPLRDAYQVVDQKIDLLMQEEPSISRGECLYELLLNTHAGASAQSNSSAYLRPGWVLLALMAILKVEGRGRQAYGYSKITRSLRAFDESRVLRLAAEARSLGVQGPYRLRSASTIEYGLRDWLYGDVRTNFELRDFELFCIANVVSAEFGQVTLTRDLIEKALAQELEDLLEFQVVTYRMIQPIKDLIEGALQNAGLPFTEVMFFPTGVLERALAERRVKTIRASSTQMIRSRSTLIRWLSFTDDGRDHKRKEFAARAALMRVAWDSGRQQFCAREDVKRLYLVLDGDLRQSDVDVFLRFGWDGVFLPHEVDELARAVV